MEEEVQSNGTNEMKKVTWTEIFLTQDDHGALIVEIIVMQLKIAQN
jgi:hypothetical protein